jgi:hypothetical protein
LVCHWPEHGLRRPHQPPSKGALGLHVLEKIPSGEHG